METPHGVIVIFEAVLHIAHCSWVSLEAHFGYGRCVESREYGVCSDLLSCFCCIWQVLVEALFDQVGQPLLYLCTCVSGYISPPWLFEGEADGLHFTRNIHISK